MIVPLRTLAHVEAEIQQCLDSGREGKALLPHGEFIDWATTKFGFSDRWCRKLMELAKTEVLPIQGAALLLPDSSHINSGLMTWSPARSWQCWTSSRRSAKTRKTRRLFMADIYRQGDVLLVRVPDAPDGERRHRQNGRLVLAEGESTGHAHAILEPGAELIETSARELYLRIMSGAPALLTHQEHAAITLPPGSYKVVRQREYVPAELPRQVTD